MSVNIMLAVLVAAFLNAAWNTSVKSTPDKFLGASLICFGGAAVALPFALALPAISAAAYPNLIFSTACHVTYFLLINRAYRTADLSTAYPLMRGAAPLVSMTLAFLLLNEAPKALSVAGAIVVLAGILFLGRDAFKKGGLDRTTLIAVSSNAVVIACYTLSDGQGGRLSGQPVSYTLWLMVTAGLAFLPVALVFRGPRFFSAARTHWPMALGGGAASTGAYAIVIWAMSQAPIGLVSALRETSALFAAVLGAVFLHEKFGMARYTCAALVCCGLALVRLA